MNDKFLVPEKHGALCNGKCRDNGKIGCVKCTQEMVAQMPSKDKLEEQLRVLKANRVELEAQIAHTHATFDSFTNESISLDMESDQLQKELANLEAGYNTLKNINQRDIGCDKRRYSF